MVKSQQITVVAADSNSGSRVVVSRRQQTTMEAIESRTVEVVNNSNNGSGVVDSRRQQSRIVDSNSDSGQWRQIARLDR